MLLIAQVMRLMGITECIEPHMLDEFAAIINLLLAEGWMDYCINELLKKYSDNLVTCDFYVNDIRTVVNARKFPQALPSRRS